MNRKGYGVDMGLWNDGGFFNSMKGHVIKWWQFALRPILRINNNGNKTEYGTNLQLTQPNSVQPMDSSATQMNMQNYANVQSPVSETSQIIQQPTTPSVKPVNNTSMQSAEDKTGAAKANTSPKGSMATEDPMEVLRRINEEKEAARQKEIEKARAKASEEARIAAIMNANKVDVNAFIAAGKAAKEEKVAQELESEKKRKQEEDLKRAQEIMDRLNREAAADEAKKQAEIDQAKQDAMEKFG